MKIYLDNCCFNRPFDDQNHLRIRLEAEAKLAIQDSFRTGAFSLVWSYILDYENSKNPFPERRAQIAKWRGYAAMDVVADEWVLATANRFAGIGMRKMDALHLACACRASADYFLTTDDGILKKSTLIADLQVRDPIGFIKKRGLPPIYIRGGRADFADFTDFAASVAGY